MLRTVNHQANDWVGKVTRLLCAKGLHGLDSGGSTGGKRCCHQYHNDDEGRGRLKSHGVVYGDAVKLAAEVSGEEGDGGQREEGGNSGDKNHLAQDSGNDALARRSEGEANADLTGTLLNGVGEDSVEADGCEQEGENRVRNLRL